MLSGFFFWIQVRNTVLECNFDHGEARTSQPPLKSMYSKRFQYLLDKTMYVHPWQVTAV